MKKKLSRIISRAWSRSRHLCLCGALIVSPFFGVTAQETVDSADATKAKESLIKLYCGKQGKIAQCVGMMGSDCPQALKPIIDECYPEAVKLPPEERTNFFSSCFGMGLEKHYGSKIQESDDCVSPTFNKDAVKLSDEERKQIEQPKGADVFDSTEE